MQPNKKTPAIEYSACKEKGQKECIPEDPDPEPNLSDSSSIDYDSSGDRDYKLRRLHKEKKIGNERDRILSNYVQI